MTAYDKRLHAFRPDLADARLKGQVTADRFVAGRPARIVAPVADMLGEPRPDAGMNTQLLRGDDVSVFEETEGWAWVQAVRDGYVGYVSGGFLGNRADEPTHVVSAPRSFLYPGPDLKLPRSGELSLGSSVIVRDFAETRGTRYALLSTGEAIISGHLRPAGEVSDDYVEIAEQLLIRPTCGAARPPSASTVPDWCNSQCAWPDATCCAIPTCRLRPSASRSSRAMVIPACAGAISSSGRAMSRSCLMSGP